MKLTSTTSYDQKLSERCLLVCLTSAIISTNTCFTFLLITSSIAS